MKNIKFFTPYLYLSSHFMSAKPSFKDRLSQPITNVLNYWLLHRSAKNIGE